MMEGGGCSEAGDGDGPGPGDVNSLNQVRDGPYTPPPPHEDRREEKERVF